MDLKEQAQKRHDEARSAHAAIAAEYEARITGLAEDASVEDIQAITEEMTPKLDEASELVERTKAQLTEITKLDEARKASAALIPAGDVEVTEAPTYERGNPFKSYFGDLYNARFNFNRDANARLEKGHKEALADAEKRGIVYRDAEGRAMGSGSTAGGSFLPPLYFGDLYAEFKRARRVTSRLVDNRPLAAKGNTITIPRLKAASSGDTTTATLTSAQTADNASVANQDATTDVITVPVCTVAGYTDLSRQIIERSEPGLDEIILTDLLKDYNKKVNLYVVNGSGSAGQPKGFLQDGNINSITFTSGSPTVGLLYPKLLDAVRQIEENVFQPTVAYVMTARRWAWFLAALDSSGRPLAVPNMNGPYNAMGVDNPAGGIFGDNTGNGYQSGAQDRAGIPVRPAGWVVGVPVYVDETLPKTNGAGTNEDIILTGAFEESILWEDAAGPRDFQFEGVLSSTAGIRVQVFGYMAFTSERYSKANSKITGTGLVAPTF